MVGCLESKEFLLVFKTNELLRLPHVLLIRFRLFRFLHVRRTVGVFISYPISSSLRVWRLLCSTVLRSRIRPKGD